MVDPWLLSGLTNCGYREDELPALRASWAPHLNRWHLFDHADAADRFRALSDERVPEHAPFMVCGIFMAR